MDLDATERLQTAATLQPEAQLQRDLFGVFRQDGKRARAHVAQADDAYVHFLHMGIMAGHRRGPLGIGDRSAPGYN